MARAAEGVAPCLMRGMPRTTAGPPAHNRLKDRIARVLGNILDERGCDVMTSDPDVVVACNPSYEGLQLTNPQLIVEVLLPGSVERDLRQKLQQYQKIANVDEYWVTRHAILEGLSEHCQHQSGSERA